jgi:tRNA pseudouridine38-40 synthase
MAIQRWKLTLEYVGTDFCGWQRQADDIPSIQSELEGALYGFCQQKLTVHVAGRTDAGVHAKGQVVHFDLDYGERELTGYDLLKALNAHLRPKPISVVHAEKVRPDFHARFEAVNKLYVYRIINRPAMLAVDKGLALQFKKPLDSKTMAEAAGFLLGHHDFSTFRDSQCQAKSPMKTLDRLDVIEKEYDGSGGKEICIEAEAKSFLHHQVRNMVGSLLLVGEGKWQGKDLKEALEAKERTAGGPTAPAEGLYLVRVDY